MNVQFISYAQNYEDVTLWRVLQDVKKGFHVVAGAADPEEYSVTRSFYDHGVSGINLKPPAEYFDTLKKRILKVSARCTGGHQQLVASRPEVLPPDSVKVPETLPALARRIDARLQSAVSESETVNGNR